MAKLSEEQIQKIIDTYAKVGTYSGTAKICGNSISTIKKYAQGATNVGALSEVSTSAIKLKLNLIPKSDILPLDEIVFPQIRGDWLIITQNDLDDIEKLRREVSG